jgi:acetyl-CoA carboxylase biotin carboxylase subunit
MGISPVAVYSDADRGSLHVRVSDKAINIGPPPASESYLSIERILSAARESGAEAIHPGYGFLSENAAFAEVVRACSLTFIGPSPEAIRLMGDKAQARQIAKQAGVPVVPGSEEPLKDAEEAVALAESIGFPVIFKAAAGGGGRGMRIVRQREGAAEAFTACQSEAGAAFGSSEIYCEKYIERARHVEVQVLGDKHGMRLHLGERDCSVQRRHQKLIEESPAPSLAEESRTGLHKAGLAAAAAVNYTSAGTIEFLVDDDGRFYFIEMNTRIQVEHPVTEMVTGLDLIKEQLRIAAGERLGYRQEDVRFSGHAIECRINAENPLTFAPSAGRVTTWLPPGGREVRVDSHLMAGYAVPPTYDSLIAKVIVRGETRDEALARMRRALAETMVDGVKTTIPFLQRVLAHPAFVEGRFTSADSADLVK